MAGLPATPPFLHRPARTQFGEIRSCCACSTASRSIWHIETLGFPKYVHDYVAARQSVPPQGDAVEGVSTQAPSPGSEHRCPALGIHRKPEEGVGEGERLRPVGQGGRRHRDEVGGVRRELGPSGPQAAEAATASPVASGEWASILLWSSRFGQLTSTSTANPLQARRTSCYGRTRSGSRNIDWLLTIA